MIEHCEADDGAVTDEALIGLLGSAFDEGRRGRAASDVLARGRRLRRRKRAVPAFGALGIVAVSAGLALAFTGPAGPAGAGSGHVLNSHNTVVNVDEASFSVHTDPKTGAVTVTVYQFSHEDELKQILAEAGIRAVFDPPCDGPGIKELDLAAYPGVITLPLSHGSHVVVVDPSKMPSGSVLVFDFTPGPWEPYKAFGIGLLSGEPTGACAPG